MMKMITTCSEFLMRNPNAAIFGPSDQNPLPLSTPRGTHGAQRVLLLLTIVEGPAHTQEVRRCRNAPDRRSSVLVGRPRHREVKGT